MTDYQYWRGNIFLGHYGQIEREELTEATTCPYCKADTDMLYVRVVEMLERDKLNRALYYTDEAGRFHRCSHIEKNPIGCPECIQEYERGEKGYYPEFGLGDYDEDMEIRINTRGTAYER